jgi:hypothetical protein
MQRKSKIPQEAQEQVKWKAFQHDGKTCDLAHLHPRTFRFERPAEGNRPAAVYEDWICYLAQPNRAARKP